MRDYRSRYLQAMKILVLVRHAKSSWSHDDLSDFERPLNDRGKKDAPEMAARLKDRKMGIDRLVSSPAKRAKKTAKYFAEELDFKKDDIQIVDELYGATHEAFTTAIANINDSFSAVVLFSHNPGITEFAQQLTTTRIDEMPTCAMFGVQADVDHWSEFANAQKSFLFFDFPKDDR